MKAVRFFMYNNIVPVAFSLVLLGAGSAFAATDPQALLASQQKVVSVDNSYIVNKDLSTYTPTVEITGVTEDADNYYVAYNISTIDLKDYAWQDVTRSDTMTVAKAELKGGDLGLYVTGQFKNIIANEFTYLTEVQDKEKQNITQAVVATTYSGLIGKFLNDKTQTLPDYTPVVTPPAPASADASQAAAVAGSASVPQPSGGGSGNSSVMSLQLLGNNPAALSVGDGYVDLGVVLVDPGDPNLGYQAYVDGVLSPASVTVPTTQVGAHTVEYRATDQNGNTILVRRIVLVGGAQDPGGEINTAGNVTSSAPPAPPPTPAPTPSPDTSTPPPSDTTAPATSPDTEATSSVGTSLTTPPSDTSATNSPSDDATTTAPSDASSTPTQ